MAKIQIRLADDRKVAWFLKSEEVGVSLTRLIIDAVENGTVRPKKGSRKVDEGLLRQIASVGNNLNQLAKWANTHKGDVDAMAVIIRLIEIDRELSALRYDFDALCDLILV